MARNDLLVRLGGAVVGIVALAMAAATVRSPVETAGTGGTSGGGVSPSGESYEPVATRELPAFLEYLLFALAIVAAVVVAWYFIVHRRDLVKLLATIVAVGLLVTLLTMGLLHFGEIPTPAEQEPPTGGNETEPGMGGGEGSGSSGPISFGPILGVLAVITAIFVGALVLTGRGDGDRLVAPSADAEPDADESEAAAVGAAAGRAAERIESSDDVDNEVYRAWRDMTRLLEVDRPETSTPGEFADAAVDAGIDRDHVDELTRLFEDVRYGHEGTTDEMEARAVSVLREIEAEYGVEDETAIDGGRVVENGTAVEDGTTESSSGGGDGR